MKTAAQPPDHEPVSPGVIIAAHYRESETYVTRRPQGRGDWLITYTLEGEGYYRLGGRKEIKCRAGDLVLLNGKAPHQYGTSAGRVWDFVWAHFTELPEIGYLPEERLVIQSFEEDHIRDRIYAAFQRVIRDSRERNAFWQELCQHALREVLLLLAQRQAKKLDARVESVLYLLSSRMKEELHLEELAAEIGLSVSRLSHLFKEETGSSILEALTRMRLEQAALLLEHTNRTATETAYEVGFQNYNHFAAQFRRKYGVSPRDYKKASRQTADG